MAWGRELNNAGQDGIEECRGEFKVICLWKTMFFFVDILMAWGRDLNMVGVSIPELLTGFKLSEA